MSFLFAPAVRHRKIRYLIHMTREERDLLKKEADRRGITSVALVRNLIRESLISADPTWRHAPEKQGRIKVRLDRKTGAARR